MTASVVLSTTADRLTALAPAGVVIDSRPRDPGVLLLTGMDETATLLADLSEAGYPPLSTPGVGERAGAVVVGRQHRGPR